MEIIDAQIDNPDPVDQDIVITDDESASRLRIEINLAAMNAVGVSAAVIHQRGQVTLQDLESVPIPAVIAPKLYPDRFAGIITPSTTESFDVNELFGQVRDRFGLVGIRMTPGWPVSGPNDMARLEGGGFDEWFVAAEEYGIPICLYVPGYLGLVADIAERFSGLTLILDHLGMYPPPRVPFDPKILHDLRQLLPLARFSNVALKFSGAPALSSESFPFGDLWPRLRPVLDTFGPSRLMWGSDYTRVAELHTYAEAVNFLRLTDEVSEEDKAAMFAENVQRWLCWKRPSA